MIGNNPNKTELLDLIEKNIKRINSNIGHYFTVLDNGQTAYKENDPLFSDDEDEV